MASADPAFWAEAAKPYEGVTIRGVSESTPPSNYVKDVIAPQFTKDTGIKVEFETTSWDQMYDKAIKDMEAKTGLYDFVYIEQDIIYSYLAGTSWSTSPSRSRTTRRSPTPASTRRKFTSFIDYFKDPKTQDLYGVPMEAFVKVYLYRKDLFEDPEAKEAFKAKYGRELAPAKTFQEYQDNADFFTAWGKEQRSRPVGHHGAGLVGPSGLVLRVLRVDRADLGRPQLGPQHGHLARHVDKGGKMNSDEAKAALAFWIGLLKDAPPEATSSTWDEVAASFAAGRAAQGWVYGENAAWIATDADQVQRRGQGRRGPAAGGSPA